MKMGNKAELSRWLMFAIVAVIVFISSLGCGPKLNIASLDPAIYERTSSEIVLLQADSALTPIANIDLPGYTARFSIAASYRRVGIAEKNCMLEVTVFVHSLSDLGDFELCPEKIRLFCCGQTLRHVNVSLRKSSKPFYELWGTACFSDSLVGIACDKEADTYTVQEVWLDLQGVVFAKGAPLLTQKIRGEVKLSPYTAPR